MTRTRRAVALLLAMPMAGCVFAVGGDDEGNEELRDRVRALERRIDRLEGGEGFRDRPIRRMRAGDDLPVPERPAPPESVPDAPK